MAKKDLNEVISAPKGVTVTKEGTALSVKGPKGAVIRNFDNPSVEVKVSGSEVSFVASSASKKTKAVIHAYVAHLKNAFHGVTEQYVYKLKVCSGHFPMNVSVSGKNLLIKNYLGEKVPRQVRIKEGVTVKVETDIINVEGADKELTAQVAADMEQATKRPQFDRRIFQDGLYIIEKAGKKV